MGAGNGIAASLFRTPHSVHPRARGERASSTTRLPTTGGSSPRSRGTANSPNFTEMAARFIPALAGNGSLSTSGIKRYSVHPRARGERLYAAQLEATIDGSSPRSRGTGDSKAQTAPRSRFIPALAGNGPAGSGCNRCHAVHPRACGERYRLRCYVHCYSGSSPRSRGTVLIRLDSGHIRRFIPALAGNG